MTEPTDADAVGQALQALRAVNTKRGGTKAKPPCRQLDEVQLAALLSAGDTGESSFAWALEQLAAALELARQQHVLLTLALASEAWRAAEAAAPLQGLSVSLTGVSRPRRARTNPGLTQQVCYSRAGALPWTVCCAMGSEDTHAVLGGLVRRCGGEVVASVAKGSTGLLIVGRGEKGENGKPDGKGGRAGLKRRLSFGGCSTAPARLASLKGQGAPCSPGAQPGLPSCQRKHRAASGAGLRCAAHRSPPPRRGMPHLEANRPASREQQQVCRGVPLQRQPGGRG